MQPSEAAGVNVMAEALVSAGALSREAAARMLAAETGEGAGGGQPPEAAHGHQHGARGQAPAHAYADAGSGATTSAAVAQLGASPDANPDANPTAHIGASDADGHADQGNAVREHDGASIADAVIDPLFAPPATPEDYRFEMRPSTGMQPAHLRSVQQWCHGARLPLPIAQSLYSEVERHAGNATPLAPAAQHARNVQGLAELRSAWGERTDSMLGLGRRLVAEVGQAHPGLIDFLEASGAGSNPRVVRQLAEHAARIYAQPHGKPRTKGGRP